MSPDHNAEAGGLFAITIGCRYTGRVPVIWPARLKEEHVS
jgi:hypothetical protein